MENRIALIGIVVDEPAAVERLNSLLHEYAAHIQGRMGLSLKERQIGLISVALDAPQAVISALAGKLGMIPGVTAKTLYAKEK